MEYPVVVMPGCRRARRKLHEVHESLALAGPPMFWRDTVWTSLSRNQDGAEMGP